MSRLYPVNPPANGGSTGGNTNPGGGTGTPGIPGVIGGSVSDSNPDVGVTITTNVKWTFTKAIDQNDVDLIHFIVTKKSDGTVISGNVTIDSTNKIVTFVPDSIQASTTYTATANAVDLLDGSGSTTPISIDFTTIA